MFLAAAVGESESSPAVQVLVQRFEPFSISRVQQLLDYTQSLPDGIHGTFQALTDPQYVGLDTTLGQSLCNRLVMFLPLCVRCAGPLVLVALSLYLFSLLLSATHTYDILLSFTSPIDSDVPRQCRIKRTAGQIIPLTMTFANSGRRDWPAEDCGFIVQAELYDSQQQLVRQQQYSDMKNQMVAVRSSPVFDTKKQAIAPRTRCEHSLELVTCCDLPPAHKLVIHVLLQYVPASSEPLVFEGLVCDVYCDVEVPPADGTDSCSLSLSFISPLHFLTRSLQTGIVCRIDCRS